MQGLLEMLVLGPGLSGVNQTPENTVYTQFWLSIDQLRSLLFGVGV